jgi:hypothetical protein
VLYRFTLKLGSGAGSAGAFSAEVSGVERCAQFVRKSAAPTQTEARRMKGMPFL